MATIKRKPVVIPTPVAVLDAGVSCDTETPVPREEQGQSLQVGGWKKRLFFPRKAHFDPAGRLLKTVEVSPIAKELKFTLSRGTLKPSLHLDSSLSISTHLTQTWSSPRYRPLSSRQLHPKKLPAANIVQSSPRLLRSSQSQLSIMDYFHLLSLRPDTGRRTPHTHQRRAASKAGYRTKLQKDPVLQRSPFGAYSYADCYELDEPFLRKMFQSVSSRQQGK